MRIWAMCLMAGDPSIPAPGQDSRRWFATGLLCFAALIVLSVIFFRERIAFCDTAYQAVYILMEQRPWVNWYRPGASLPQIIPLAGIWLHAGLRSVMIWHSMSFILFFVAIYLMAYRSSRRSLLFFIAPLYLLLITTHVFYWPQSELQQGMLWLCLYAVWLYEGTFDRFSPWVRIALHFLVLLWVLSFHPLIFIAVLLLVIYHAGSISAITSRPAILLMVISIAAFACRLLIGMQSPYEHGKLDLSYALEHHLPHLFSLPSVHDFIIHTPSYSVYLLTLLGSATWLLCTRQYTKAVVLLSLSAGYWVLIMISTAPDLLFYTENMLLPLAFMAALPLVADILPTYPVRITWPVVIVMICLRIGAIYSAHIPYTERYAAYDPFIRLAREKKLNGVYVDEKQIDMHKTIIAWASGYETMLVTSLQSPDSCVIVQVDPAPDRYIFALRSDTCAITPYAIWCGAGIQRRYFHLPGGYYEIVR